MKTQSQVAAFHFPDGKRFYSLNDFCKQYFGQKTYRLSINGGMTCPNRDGTLSSEGCYFCSEGGSGDFAAHPNQPIQNQLEEAKQRISNKTHTTSYIAYFQAFTNTYAPVGYLRQIYTEAIQHPDVVALSIATRSDCITPEIAMLLEELSHIKPIWIELGLQTIHNQTLQALNTHTTVEQFEESVTLLHSHHIPVVAHLIIGLPNETKEMIKESVLYLAKMHSQIPLAGVKLQLLHILKNTPLHEMYRQNPFPIFELDEYCDFIIDCLELLPPTLSIHRLTGDGPKHLLIEPQWSANKKKVLNQIQRRLKERDTFQGRHWNPSINEN